jgi:hypothetical protein
VVLIYMNLSDKKDDYYHRTRLFSYNACQFNDLARDIVLCYRTEHTIPKDIKVLVNNEKLIDCWNNRLTIKYTFINDSTFKLRSSGPDKQYDLESPVLTFDQLYVYAFMGEKVPSGDILEVFVCGIDKKEVVKCRISSTPFIDLASIGHPLYLPLKYKRQ